MVLEGEYSLTIFGDDINFTEIEKVLGIRASKTVEKGKKIVANRIAPISVWTYTKKNGVNGTYEDGLKEFLCEINARREKIAEIALHNNVELNCFLRSEYGQMGYSMTPDMLKILAEMELPINFHILSFGKAET